MAALLQRGQIVRIITALPTIKHLSADAEVAAGVSHVVAASVEIHPAQPHPRFPAQLHPDPSQSARPRRFPLTNLHFDTLRVSLIILNESTDNTQFCPNSLASQKQYHIVI